ncbi:unnamed protein product [Paramecium sonneborni]|uniref:Uncharacterized protein n=1 Tax=Paramecium sonneborni TaxID=65129 RepID=A0A8S1NA15_9CILI|nr:unnamed protein product [Paramecium sonneborni]
MPFLQKTYKQFLDSKQQRQLISFIEQNVQNYLVRMKPNNFNWNRILVEILGQLIPNRQMNLLQCMNFQQEKLYLKKLLRKSKLRLYSKNNSLLLINYMCLMKLEKYQKKFLFLQSYYTPFLIKIQLLHNIQKVQNSGSFQNLIQLRKIIISETLLRNKEIICKRNKNNICNQGQDTFIQNKKYNNFSTQITYFMYINLNLWINFIVAKGSTKFINIQIVISCS